MGPLKYHIRVLSLRLRTRLSYGINSYCRSNLLEGLRVAVFFVTEGLLYPEFYLNPSRPCTSPQPPEGPPSLFRGSSSFPGGSERKDRDRDQSYSDSVSESIPGLLISCPCLGSSTYLDNIPLQYDIQSLLSYSRNFLYNCVDQ